MRIQVCTYLCVAVAWQCCLKIYVIFVYGTFQNDSSQNAGAQIHNTPMSSAQETGNDDLSSHSSVSDGDGDDGGPPNESTQRQISKIAIVQMNETFAIFSAHIFFLSLLLSFSFSFQSHVKYKFLLAHQASKQASRKKESDDETEEKKIMRKTKPFLLLFLLNGAKLFFSLKR